jgi:predicted ester cyclase
MSNQENIKAAQAVFNAWNAGDLRQGEMYSAEDALAENPGAPGPLSVEQNRMYLENFMTAFPGTRFEILLTLTDGDYVVTHWKASGGRHNGPLLTPSGGTIPPTGNAAVVLGSTTARLKDGKVTYTWTFWDMASLLVQIGILPAM